MGAAGGGGGATFLITWGGGCVGAYIGGEICWYD